jgi:hypothetical protein
MPPRGFSHGCGWADGTEALGGGRHVAPQIVRTLRVSNLVRPVSGQSERQVDTVPAAGLLCRRKVSALEDVATLSAIGCNPPPGLLALFAPAAGGTAAGAGRRPTVAPSRAPSGQPNRWHSVLPVRSRVRWIYQARQSWYAVHGGLRPQRRTFKRRARVGCGGSGASNGSTIKSNRPLSNGTPGAASRLTRRSRWPLLASERARKWQ